MKSLVITFSILGALVIFAVIPISVLATNPPVYTVTVHLNDDVTRIFPSFYLEQNLTHQVTFRQGERFEKSLSDFFQEQELVILRPLFRGWFLDADLAIPLNPHDTVARNFSVWAGWDF